MTSKRIQQSMWLFCLALCSSFSVLTAQQKTDIFELMERKDLKFQEVEQLADQHFNSVGRGQGSGNKHFERWRYEQQFHLNEDGTYRTMEKNTMHLNRLFLCFGRNPIRVPYGQTSAH
jgi:hypothetical protein